MKLPVEKKETEKKSHAELLAGLQARVKLKAKKQKDLSCAKCPYGCPWQTKNKYRKQVTPHYANVTAGF